MLATLAALSLCIAAHAADADRSGVLSHGPWPPKVSAAKPEMVAFGERLFFDPALSGTGSVLCATCHIPYRTFQDGRPRAFGLETVDRNTPTLLNVGLYRRFGWDGARDSLAKQSIRPLLEPREMRSSASHVAARVRKSLAADYARAFGAAPAADDEAVLADVGSALAAYQATLFSGRAPFDDFRDALEARDAKRMARYPEAAQRGVRVFVAECSTCHAGPHFSSSAIIDGFRVPGLRNVALTAPYMHDGHIATLEEAAGHTGTKHGKDLVEFLHTISMTQPLVQQDHALRDLRP
jgi:cytochrome c peroxidase